MNGEGMPRSAEVQTQSPRLIAVGSQRVTHESEGVTMVRTSIAAAIACMTLSAGAATASAQEAREAQLIGFHQLCERGDKPACVKFGMMLQQNRDRHDDWRRSHPEFFFFEH